MGVWPIPDQCFITGEQPAPFHSTVDCIEYVVTYSSKNWLFRFEGGYAASPFVKENNYVLLGLLLNRKFPPHLFGREGEILNNQYLEMIIRESDIPRRPEERFNNLLMYIHSQQDHEGASITLKSEGGREELAHKLYFKNYTELSFYLITLKGQSLLGGKWISDERQSYLSGIRLTYDGLSKVVELAEAGSQSDRCFIAMSFSRDLADTRAAIKEAVSDAGFQPILIDEIHIDSDVTINDALIAEIKKCKFLIADFTQHKHGVYFEAGFALGLKRPVIYLCHKSDFDNTHFDTNHYPHIIYESLDELKEKLKTKIEAWIA